MLGTFWRENQPNFSTKKDDTQYLENPSHPASTDESENTLNRAEKHRNMAAWFYSRTKSCHAKKGFFVCMSFYTTTLPSLHITKTSFLYVFSLSLSLYKNLLFSIKVITYTLQWRINYPQAISDISPLFHYSTNPNKSKNTWVLYFWNRHSSSFTQ